MATTSSNANNSTKVAVSALSEAVVPGGSHLLKGDFTQGAVHLALGLAASLAIGPWGLAAVKALSLAKSTTGQSPLDKVIG